MPSREYARACALFAARLPRVGKRSRVAEPQNPPRDAEAPREKNAPLSAPRTPPPLSRARNPFEQPETRKMAQVPNFPTDAAFRRTRAAMSPVYTLRLLMGLSAGHILGA